MRVLIACEFSGVVRDAFLKRGHDAYSCDLLPSEGSPRFRHVQGDVLEILYQKWDLMIAHPPCTFIANSGAKHLYRGGKKVNGVNQARWLQMVQGAYFFKRLWNMDIKRICIENPIIVGHAKKIIGASQAQIIQPWQFGHAESKQTCLWLKALPELEPVTDLEEEMQALPKSKGHRVHYASPSPNRWKDRSRTYQGIADAMASQWGQLT